ncbi:hypothetical protein CC1G_13868 [Coprinopsis cinerea okayama7|uniref:AB hydrolase-1 domain-containing protein n=1 Tax=Coprinopsis cinerea (strain Okayama-7 / 130 / ATCC MYA-4618 / FGSC 9003) TaxID=240176 RepID=D6RKF7_COPC7|nr:hypothetical protein CC1G_13868 [Coprinopsis cinerea okayama7\|eukprot:XP_002911832.1 hypothetical protein CC1G_13868 [Coprinopsis cinerea okayama7\
MSFLSSPISALFNIANRWLYRPIKTHWPSPFPTRAATPEYVDGEYILDLPDGARLAYQVLGSQHLNSAIPLVLICGMSSLKTDFVRLTETLVETHTVLLYDHRGMGGSKLTEAGDEDLSIELMARDLLRLVSHLGWSKVALIGYSMGGVIAQQLLTLPFHSTNPTSIPFTVTHVVLASTRSKVHSVGLKLGPSSTKPLTPEERMALTRRVVHSLVDPKFIEEDKERFEKLVQRSIVALPYRPSAVIAKQAIALQKFKFDHFLGQLSRDIQILVLHGQLDQVIPPYCGQEILESIPWARKIEVGDKEGQVPSLDFGHYWFEYFDARVWHDVIHTFLETSS